MDRFRPGPHRQVRTLAVRWTFQEICSFETAGLPRAPKDSDSVGCNGLSSAQAVKPAISIPSGQERIRDLLTVVAVPVANRCGSCVKLRASWRPRSQLNPY